MKKRIFTLLMTVFLGSGFMLQAQTTYNVPPDSALNEFISNNYDESGLSTYVLERDGYYVLTGSMNFSGDIAIVAEEGDGMRPVIIMGTNDEGASNGWGMLWTDGSIYYKSLNLKVTNDLGARGPWSSALFSSSGSNVTFEMTDCIVEYSDGVSIWNETGTEVTLILRDNLFRWNGTNDGGRWQGFGSLLKNGSLDWAIMENNTFVENYSSLFIHENGHVKNFFFNHNTVVSNGQGPLRYMYADRAVCMNNLFVDAHFGGETPQAMAGQDAELLPMGIYAIDYYRAGDTIKPTGYPAEEDRINVIAYNVNYVSPEIKDYWANMPDTFIVADYEKGDNGFLNERAYQMMKSEGDYNYPHFLWDDNLSVFVEAPGFTGYDLKVQQEIEISKHMNGYDANLSTEMGQWGRYPEADGNAAFPLPKEYYDFAYTNEQYQLAAHEGYPLGDLNWWPQKYEQWKNDENKEDYDEIISSVLDGSFEFVDWYTRVEVDDHVIKMTDYLVYPNPVSGDILTVKGAENKVKTIYGLTGQMLLQTREDRIDVSSFSSGMYLIKIGNSVQKVSIK